MVNTLIRQGTVDKREYFLLEVYCESVHSLHFLRIYSNFKLVIMGAAVVAPEIVAPAAAALIADGGVSAIGAVGEHQRHP